MAAGRQPLGSKAGNVVLSTRSRYPVRLLVAYGQSLVVDRGPAKDKHSVV